MRFSRKRQDGYALNFVSNFKRKHLFITTYIEKQCTRSLKHAGKQVRRPRQLQRAGIIFICYFNGGKHTF